MSSKLYIEQRFSCSPATLVGLLADDSFDEKLMAYLEIKREVLDASEEGGVIRRKLRLTPPTSLPGFMKKLVKSGAYIENRSWDTERAECGWTIDMSSAKVGVSGVVTVVSDGASGSKRVNDGTVDIRIPLVGGKVEKFIIKQTEDSFAKAAEFISSYIADNDLS